MSVYLGVSSNWHSEIPLVAIDATLGHQHISIHPFRVVCATIAGGPATAKWPNGGYWRV